ncbi:FKBP-type peptidyl-prolyl cis-trans isomerase [Leucobacter tardus]|uniref:FKBP-type peptidyl-prolyl cis-trans isomerase n=1 Tax=Leucobacter tardus TaxID=501483 RepID=UPI002443E9F6|nr:FKBP-type peptidyl-prolyl cis-trans isomerase [Leucobacter tardus]
MTDAALTKPEIDFPDGPPPAEIEVIDLVEGDGDAAERGSTVEVHYLGVDYESGEEFDSSWSRGETIRFPLRSLIEGWQIGIPGMRTGGRRKLIVPPAQAYGNAAGHPLAGKTLIFIIDLVSVG